MRCFELIKIVLDDVYPQIPASSEDEKDSKIRDCLDYLTDRYRNLLAGPSIDYTDPATRFAYIYKYVTSHANIVYQWIQWSSQLRSLFSSNRVRVACLGGGPGSDFLGVLKFMEMGSISCTLQCLLFDREPRWGVSWRDVLNRIGDPLPVQTFFQSLDVTDESTWNWQVRNLDADLHTLIYFMSEVYHVRDAADAFFASAFQNAKPGSCFLYIDNREPIFRDWFDSLASNHGLTFLTREYREMSLAGLNEEQKTDLGVYYQKFGWPKMTASVDCRVCQKAWLL